MKTLTPLGNEDDIRREASSVQPPVNPPITSTVPEPASQLPPPAPQKLPGWAKVLIVLSIIVTGLLTFGYPVAYFVARDPYAHIVGAQEIDAVPIPPGCSEVLREKTPGSFDIHAAIDAELSCEGGVTAGEAYEIINPHFADYDDRQAKFDGSYDFTYHKASNGCYVSYDLLTGPERGNYKGPSATDKDDRIKRITINTSCTLPIF